MLSFQAKIVKHVMRASSSKKTYTNTPVNTLRHNFDRNLTIMFPSTNRAISQEHIAGVPVDVVTPKCDTGRAIVYVHGGGFILGSVRSHRQHIKRLAKLCKAKVYAIDYSLAPESPYPIALDQIQLVWEKLIADNTIDPRHAVFMGDSAGGNLALATLLRLRDRHIVMPSCLVMLSPGLDATLSGSSHMSKANSDPILNRSKLELFVNSYVGNASKQDPIVSPIFADLHSLPPMLVHVGSEELLLSDSQTITDHAKRDGVDSTLFVGEGLWHGWHFFASYVPEAKQAMKYIAKFVDEHS